MKLIALLFAVLAAVPQALKWMAYGFAKKLGGCTLPAKVCLIHDNDQSHLLNMFWGPNGFTTYGLWIGTTGFILSFGAMKVLEMLDNRRTNAMINRADRSAGVGGTMGQNTPGQPRSENSYGRMPRPPAFDKYGRPRQ